MGLGSNSTGLVNQDYMSNLSGDAGKFLLTPVLLSFLLWKRNIVICHPMFDI